MMPVHPGGRVLRHQCTVRRARTGGAPPCRLGIGADHYDRWLDSLVATVAEFDPECDQATELAWRWALAPGITFMKLYEYFQSERL